MLHRCHFFQGRPIRGSETTDLSWIAPLGEEMTDEAWESARNCLGMRLAGDVIDELGEQIVGDTLLILLNSSHKQVPFHLPATAVDQRWETVFDSANDADPLPRLAGGIPYPLEARALAGRGTGARS